MIFALGAGYVNKGGRLFSSLVWTRILWFLRKSILESLIEKRIFRITHYLFEKTLIFRYVHIYLYLLSVPFLSLSIEYKNYFRECMQLKNHGNQFQKDFSCKITAQLKKYCNFAALRTNRDWSRRTVFSMIGSRSVI